MRTHYLAIMGTMAMKKQVYKHSTNPNPTGGQWQIVLKLAGAKRRGFTGSAYAYEARNRQGEMVFWGIRSYIASSAAGVVHEALVEASI
uniref:Uncharacterized protein n=1 Tax=Quercus lobata TaxID=97700 RepID=A0A7N2LYH2_QUELO